jgi:thiol-disulfide isomerase/thioredoxin
MSYYGSYATYSSINSEFKCDEISKVEQRYNIINSNYIVCVYVGAKWCEPCKKCGPEYDKLAEKYNNKGFCMLVKEDIDLDLGREFEISSVPSFVFYINRELNSNIIVGANIQRVEEFLKEIVNLSG